MYVTDNYEQRTYISLETAYKRSRFTTVFKLSPFRDTTYTNAVSVDAAADGIISAAAVCCAN